MSTSVAFQTSLFEKYLLFFAYITLSQTFLDLPTYVGAVAQPVDSVLFYYIYVILLAPILLIRFDALLRFIRTPYAIWAAAFVILNLFHFAILATNTDTTQAKIVSTRIQFIILTGLMTFAYSLVKTMDYQRVFNFVAILLPCLVIFDFFSQGVFYQLGPDVHAVIGRASALYINPTRAGEGVLLALLLALPGVSVARRPFYLILSGVAAILTFSRSSILTWFLTWIVLQVRRSIPKYMSAVLIGLVIGLPVISALLQAYIGAHSDSETDAKNIVDRIQFFQTKSLGDESAMERAAVLQAGIELFERHPIFGAGAAATWVWELPVSTHNEVILMGAEYGIFGIFIWLWMGYLLYRGRYFQDRAIQMCMVMTYFSQSAFTHNMFDSFFWLQAFALTSGKYKT